MLTLQDRFYQQLKAYLLAEGQKEKRWQELYTYYSADKRAYHNLDHLTALFTSFDEHHHALAEPEIVAWAIWYHDIIYNAKRRDNEEQSALLAAERLQSIGLAPDEIVNCMDYIRATAQHLLVETDSASDLAYFLDFDLAVLAWPREAYQQYADNIRQEYQHVPGFLYRRGRRKVLRYFLESARLFRTDIYYEKYEAAARKNLRWELAEG